MFRCLPDATSQGVGDKAGMPIESRGGTGTGKSTLIWEGGWKEGFDTQQWANEGEAIAKLLKEGLPDHVAHHRFRCRDAHCSARAG